jgi:hypothetical protein
MHNYQSDGSYAIAQMLLAGQQVKLVGFTDPAEALAASLGLGSAAFVRFRPPEFLGDRPTSVR